MTGRPFQWVETAGGLRHATADDDISPGREVLTLCGYRQAAQGWHAWPYPSCRECDAVWRQVEGIAPAPARAAQAGTR